MHVAQVGFHVDARQRRPLELLRDWPSLVDIAEAAAQCGSRVSVVQACAQAGSVDRCGVGYHFVAPRRANATPADSQEWVEPIGAVLGELNPDLIHVHGLDHSGAVIALARRLPGTPMLLQDHASRPPRIWRRRYWRRGAACAAGIAICSREQLEPYRAARLIPGDLQVFEIPESSSRFTVGDREDARRVTGLSGDPAVLWVGRLDANKDPLTVMEAVRGLAVSLPKLELWCVYGSKTLLPEIERLVRSDPLLGARVHLLGEVPHERVELLMRAADLYVSASRREGSGYALIEALACGLPPVVSDIPSFRALTSGGSVGDLWDCGNVNQLAVALTRAAARPRRAARQQVRDHFTRELSFDAVGTKLVAAYSDLINRSTRGPDS